ncbi:NADH-cytochrome b5 reductase [Coemansia sp. RSA 2706]|nr:NADH-cytochrome b5 reductase [Coemansia sp. RSA 2711]KAJ2298084.1 NADH-cytochrome b5 reductase [Coemansia sp. RSA 2706]KAJ2318224.1 NADH-cytochrome b5 reductase [Coemansia sp. RSA 2704]KAJ2322156.1 NADH-cytochrome b5 reductase [Coemansia sp. RSA 2702]KAJ2739688.1 NADH-cytochrome b5 reductase [Coemansia sp. Cherry 401B]
MSESNGLVYIVGALLAAGIAYFIMGGGSRKDASDTVLATTGPALHPSEYRQFKLTQKTQLSDNTARYRFELPTPESTLGLPIGRHIQVMVVVDGKQVARSYTPTSTDNDRGYFELVVKTYEAGVVSAYLHRMQIGDTVSVRGPRGTFQYQPNMVRAIGMIAGGTGITPMYQIIQHVLANPEDRTRISVVFANVNEEDILLREQLEKWAADHDNFEIHYVLNNPPESWSGGVGFVTKDIIEKWMPQPADDIKVLLCGPPPMVKAMGAHLSELGYDSPKVISKPDDQVFKF